MAPVDAAAALATVAATCAAFLLLGLWVSRRRPGGARLTADAFVAARGQIGAPVASATVLASMLGGWILFSPAESAAVGGVVTVAGYALGTAAPLLAYAVLGRRLRRVMPHGHGLTEFVHARYGGVMYAVTLGVMLAVLLIFLTAGLSAVAQVVGVLTGAPSGLAAAMVLAAALGYTLVSGLRGSILTDAVQILVVLPLLAVLVAVGFAQAGGLAAVTAGLAERAPELLDWRHGPGLETGAALILAILVAEIFNQSYWQRVYAARSDRAMLLGFLGGALVVIPVVAAMGLFGLAAVALGRPGEAPVAAFLLVREALPGSLALLVVVLGVALVISSLDSLLSALSSLVVSELPRAAPRLRGDDRAVRLARAGMVVLAVPPIVGAIQGFSIFYLLLLADLICAAAAFPVFYGLWARRWTGGRAAVAFFLGLAAGGLVFVPPDFGPAGLLHGLTGADWAEASLLKAFLAATLVPAAAGLALRGGAAARFDFAAIQAVGR
jgi:Na+/proline symporter